MANPRNQASISQLRELLTDASTFFLVDYQGLSAGDMHRLRARVRAAGGRLLVAKNTLVHVVLAEHGIEGFEGILQGPTALVLVGDDPVAPAKALSDFAREHPKDRPAAKGGRLQGTFVGPEALYRIATLPGREVLYAQLVGVLQAPMSRLVGMLQAPGQNLVSVIDNYLDKRKEGS